MEAHAPTTDNPLESATSQMRDLCREVSPLPPSLDHGSVGRMLVHIDNINRSVIVSTQDHLNAAKRLNDFALIFSRVAKQAEPPDGALAVRMISVADNLRAASEELSSADAIPKWRAPDLRSS